MVSGAETTERLRSNERREQLLGVASRLFAASGYDATTMDQVAVAAGVTKPLLYQHFESKHALYEEIVTSAATELLDRLAVAASPDASPREKVERGFRAYFTSVLGDDVAFRLLLIESTDEDISWHLNAIERALIEFLDPLIDAGLGPDHRQAARGGGRRIRQVGGGVLAPGVRRRPGSRPDRGRRAARRALRAVRLGRPARRRA